MSFESSPIDCTALKDLLVLPDRRVLTVGGSRPNIWALERYANTYVNIFAYPASGSYNTSCAGSASPAAATTPYTHPLVFTVTAASAATIVSSNAVAATTPTHHSTHQASGHGAARSSVSVSSPGGGGVAGGGTSGVVVGGARMVTYQESTHKLLLWDVTPNGDRVRPFDYPSKPYASLVGHTDPVLNLALLPDGRLVSKSWKEVRVWNLKLLRCEAVLKLPAAKNSYAFTDTPSRLWVPTVHTNGGVEESSFAAQPVATSSIF